LFKQAVEQSVLLPTFGLPVIATVKPILQKLLLAVIICDKVLPNLFHPLSLFLFSSSHLLYPSEKSSSATKCSLLSAHQPLIFVLNEKR
jgi:hypothetical protein